MNKSILYKAVVAAMLVASSSAALAVDDTEPNNQISTAQPLTIPADGTITINGIMGVLSTNMADRVGDLDFYSFEGKNGDVITLDIDHGWKTPGAGVVSVDTMVYVFKPDLSILDDNNSGTPVDEGSLANPLRPAESRDALIENLALPVDGTYYIGVTSAPRVLLDGGLPSPGTALMLNSQSMGSYTLIVSGFKRQPPIQTIAMDVKPGQKKADAPLNPKAKGVVPVALLSSPEFDPMTIDTKTLTFGATGDEGSLANCHKNNHKDWNSDGKPDLVCHFDNERASFSDQSSSAFVKGKTNNGKQFQGRGGLKVLRKVDAE